MLKLNNHLNIERYNSVTMIMHAFNGIGLPLYDADDVTEHNAVRFQGKPRLEEFDLLIYPDRGEAQLRCYTAPDNSGPATMAYPMKPEVGVYVEPLVDRPPTFPSLEYPYTDSGEWFHPKVKGYTAATYLPHKLEGRGKVVAVSRDGRTAAVQFPTGLVVNLLISHLMPAVAPKLVEVLADWINSKLEKLKSRWS